ACWAHAAAGIAPCRSKLWRRRADPAGPAGSLPVEPRSDRSYRERSTIAPFRCLHPAGGRRGSSRREFLGGVHGLARQITLLYDRLIRIQPSPVVELNRAVAIAMYKGPEQGLCLIDDLLTREELDNYSLAYSA